MCGPQSVISRFYKIIAYAALGSRSAFQAANDKQNQKDLRSFCLGWTMDTKENKQGKARLMRGENSPAGGKYGGK
jgi:hypothetical protein